MPDIDIKELVKLCAVDTPLFERTFFPKTFRQASPPYGRRVSDLLDSSNRYINLIVFRGGAKTTKCRAYTAKRIAYGLSRTILYIGKSEGHALRSSRWLRLQVERNKFFTDTFGLRKGSKWQDHEFEVINHADGSSSNIVAMGITGSTRGVNIDDYRPDLIVLDDVISDENAATPEQRQKMERLIYGALWESLAPASENPDAKIVSLATPQNSDDYTSKARLDPQWKTEVIPCWTEDTLGLPLHEQKSAWPERWSDEVLQAEKQAAISRNQLSIWMREKECKIVSVENSVFLPNWLQRFDILPKYMDHVLTIDPVPPPSDKQIKQGLSKKDYESLAVVGLHKDYFIREVMVNKGHDPSWTIFAFLYLCRKYKVKRVVVETIAYQRVLKWILQNAMREARYWVQIIEIDAISTSKFNRIVDALTGPGANGSLFIPPDHTPEGMNHSEGMRQFVQQFLEYPNVVHDDALESVANGIVAHTNQYLSFADGTDEDEEELYPRNPVGIPGQDICP
jgi:hypothetical protein